MIPSRLALCVVACALLCGGCTSAVRTSLSFSNSLRLTRTLRARVQQLLQRYKEEEFGDRNFEDRRLTLKTLPSATINYKSWFQMQDTERLYLASHGLNTFWWHLEAQRHILEKENEGERERQNQNQNQNRNRRAHPQISLAKSILAIQLDLRDLLKQTSFQLLNINVFREGTTSDSTQIPPPPSTLSSPAPHTTAGQASQSLNPTPIPSPTSLSSSAVPAPTSSPLADANTPSPSHSALTIILSSTPWNMEVLSGRQSTSVPTEVTSSSKETTQAPSPPLPRESEVAQGKVTVKAVSGPSRWVSRLEGYVILRDLERYLSRLARDYTLLKAKY
ncbi:uncharacterized protein LOC143497423 [Brachyhypopomus gauderio]|uniref:uncharacterized protein LOC143497423 n=1 Tax=Brachyhypopomus gauderio TaxID=698409 RepID=UPI00404247F7